MPKRTECKRGHDLTDPGNVRHKKNGDRQCRPCHEMAKKAWYRRQSPKPKHVPIERDDCEVDGCDRLRRRAGDHMRSRYCCTHYHRLMKHGDLFADVPTGPSGKTLAKRRAELQHQGT